MNVFIIHIISPKKFENKEYMPSRFLRNEEMTSEFISGFISQMRM